MESRRRLVLLVFASVLFVQYLYQGHGSSQRETPMAFLRYTAGSVVVRVQGQGHSSGIYSVSRGSSVADVIKMTGGTRPLKISSDSLLVKKLHNGDTVKVCGGNLQDADISLTRMGARESMLLGIPLDPDEMTTSDWDALPGIGPALARTIVGDRQSNGDFATLEGVARVSGMGGKKVEQLRRYFR